MTPFPTSRSSGRRTSGSYPSGHTTRGMATALVLAEMAPEYQDTILRRGFEYGESRVIVSAHYQSDVYAGYMCASAIVAAMHSVPDFMTDMEAARKEYYDKIKHQYQSYMWNEYAVFECIIPTGAIYYEGHDANTQVKSYASNCIKFVKRIDIIETPHVIPVNNNVEQDTI